jgi:hypothetical protein
MMSLYMLNCMGGFDWVIASFNMTLQQQYLGYYVPNGIYYNAFVDAVKNEVKLIRYLLNNLRCV